MKWILTDSYNFADDNAEHFYRFLRDKHPEIEIYYLLNKKSPDYKRLENDGFRLITKGTDKCLKVYNKADLLISSHPWGNICKEYNFNKSKRVVFIPHGITLGDSHRYFNKYNFDLCTACVEGEYNSYVSGEYNYKAHEGVFKLTGMPRHDNLIKKIKKYKKGDERVISFVFTYRSKKEDWEKYNSTLNKLFNSKRLKELHEKHGIRFLVKFHPFIVREGLVWSFNLPDYIENCKEMSYQELLLKTDILISDYSSACQEFAVIGRNILYYQFDRDEFLSKKSIHSYDIGWFDWDNDSLGKICTTEKELIDSIDEIISNNFKVDEKYKERMDSFFKFKDTNNCERVYEAIIEMTKRERLKNSPNYKPENTGSIEKINRLRKDIREGRVFTMYDGNGKFVWTRVR